MGKPITQHRLFPVFAALWFSALFGLGSLAVRPSLLETLVAGSRIDTLLPAAAPPLGMTARILLALGLAVLGAMLGAVIARLLARPRPDPDTARHAGEQRQAPAPAAAEAEPGEGAAPVARRRALTLRPDEADLAFRDPAPVPGGNPQVFDIARAGLGMAPAAEPAAESLEQDVAAPIAPPEDDRQVFGVAPPSAPSPEAARQIFDAQPAELPAAPGLDDLSARLAESIRRRRAARAAASPAQAAPRAAPGPLPAALSRSDLAGLDEDDVPAGGTLLPARRTFMASWPAAAAAPEPVDEPDFLEEAAVAEDSYASLLGLAPAAEEPQPANAPIEPVVIFPGQAAHPSAAPAAVRPGAVSPDEAERALRAALASLQRMSGAA